MFIHQFRSHGPSYPNQDFLAKTQNTTIVASSNKRVDIIDVDGRGISPLVITIVILVCKQFVFHDTSCTFTNTSQVVIFLLVCIWNGYRLWERRSSKSRNFTITSADSYTDADIGSIVGVLSGMDDSHISRIVEDVELQAFGGAGRRA